MPKHISKETKESLVKEYQERPITIGEISERYGISKPSVGKILSQYRIKPWSREKLFSPDLIEDYFERVDTQEKAYYLGLITTDGCVFWKNRKSAFLSIELKKKDGYILEQFMRTIGCNRKLVYSQRSDTLTATVTSTKMVRDLEKYAIHPRSSLTQQFWTDVPSEYLASYLRGVVDGDGSFGFYSRPGRSVHKKLLRICSGSPVFLECLLHKVRSMLPISMPRIQTDTEKNCHMFGWARNDDLETIITFLYSTDGPFLIRKKEIADRILSEIRQYRDNGHKAAS